MPAPPNQRWSLDFVHDQLVTGRRFRILNIVDDATRECLRAVVDTSISGRRVVRELSDLIEERGAPKTIVSDRRGSGNDPGDRCPEEGHRADLERRARLVGPGRCRMALYRTRQADPRHGFVESFNGRMRDELLNETLFFTIGQAREVLAHWVDDYNTERPHSSLGYATPAAFAEDLNQQRLGLIPAVAPPALLRDNHSRSLVRTG